MQASPIPASPVETVSLRAPRYPVATAIFNSLWAAASLCTVWQRSSAIAESPLVVQLTEAAIVLAAIAVLVRPTWCAALVSLSACHLVCGLVAMPMASTTQLLWMFGGAAIVASFAIASVQQRTLRLNANALQNSFAPCLRIIFVVFLAIAGVTRLNWGFLRSDSSSVVSTLTAFAGESPTPSWVIFVTMSMLLVLDLLLACTLLLPHLRSFAVGTATVYFCWSALMGFGEARSLLALTLAYTYLFTAPEATGRLAEIARRRIPWHVVWSSGFAMLSIACVAAVVALWMQGEVYRTYSRQLAVAYQIGFVLVWSALLFFALSDQRQPRLIQVPLLMKNPIHYVVILMLVAVGISPYVGWGTLATLSADSGLVTESGSNNHLFIPQTYLADYQVDLVEILASSDPALADLAAQDHLITWFELVNYTSQRPEISLAYIRRGKRTDVPRAGDVPELSHANPWILRKLLGFRPVSHASLRERPARQVAAQPQTTRQIVPEGAR